MHFRRLTKEELFALETEFKQFLIIHELYDEEWRALAENDPYKAEQFDGIKHRGVVQRRCGKYKKKEYQFGKGKLKCKQKFLR